ncbi:hypothetical protein SAMN05192549_102101 [Duganella sacchari]|uniref:Uncharacterized protein n=1 Tax=Duganella sacchari TaxID=551987 RepID=A0A1M7KGR8_9BURK|nr:MULTISPECIES: hypothetical protein [Duganella]SHM64529.1 hypothetical protein SAMN05192549_102101 [Duganella sacchari]
MRTLLRIFQSRNSSRTAIILAFLLCGLYFASWYIISHCLTPGLISF